MLEVQSEMMLASKVVLQVASHVVMSKVALEVALNVVLEVGL